MTMLTDQVVKKEETANQQGFRQIHLIWVGVVLAVALLTIASLQVSWLRDVPEVLTLPLSNWVDFLMGKLVATAQSTFRTLSIALALPMNFLQKVLSTTPWITILSLFVAMAWIADGKRLAIFATAGGVTTLSLGLWQQAMNTLALVGISVPLSVALGFGLGAATYLFARIRRSVELLLGLMQTVPAFAYLIPILLLFGFGPVVGLIASAIFAAPPMVRNTALGLSRVPEAQIESGQMSGCSNMQLFWLVRVPGAMPQILVGINQATMQALSMVIIAAIIGGYDDVGWAVLTALRKAQFGQSLMAGLVIVYLAVLIDRITWGFAQRNAKHEGHHGVPFWRRPAFLSMSLALATVPVGLLIPALNESPRVPLVDFVDPLNSWLERFLLAYGPALTEFKTNVFYFLMFPLRAGLENAVTSFTWGFELTTGYIAAYWGMVILGATIALRRSPLFAITILFCGWLSYFGMTGVSWIALTLFMVALGYTLGGVTTAALCLLSCLFLVLSDLWDLAMLSLYLCGVAVVASLILGGIIGVLAVHSTRLSNVARVVADTLQTMPQFVLLIPFLMIFQVGEFTALLAIIIYAIVPAMRYVEQGLRGVNENIIEAAEQMGCSTLQILWQVRIPLALPVLALGINQTIMFGLAMLAITALVGTQDLGQEVYVALSQADAGRGLLAGLAIAVIALLSDRLMRDWINLLSQRRHVPNPQLAET